MLALAAPVALVSALVFAAIALLSDRPRGAAVAQSALYAGAAMIFAAVVVEGPLLGQPVERIAAFGASLMAAAAAGMLYHIYLGRFANAWAARGVFTLVYLGLAALFGLVILSLI